jgi:hypothetical protein
MFLRANRVIYFIVIVILVVICGQYINSFILTKEIVYNTYAEKMTLDQVEVFFASTKKWQGTLYLFVPLGIILKITYNSFFLTVGSLFKNRFGSFESNFNVCLKAEIIFALMQLTRILFLTFSRSINTLKDINIVPFSLQSVFYHLNNPKWIIYPMQLCNVFEVAYICFVARLISVEQNMKFTDCLFFVLSTYIPAISFWVIIVIYFTLLFS